MQWSVEKLIDPMMRRGPMMRTPMVEVVTADELVIDAGTLVFKTGGVPVNAKGPGSWAGVTLVVEEEAV